MKSIEYIKKGVVLYTNAQIAEILGLNYNEDKQIMYFGDDDSNGFGIKEGESNIAFSLVANDVSGSDSLSLQKKLNINLYVAKSDKSVAFGFDTTENYNFIATTFRHVLNGTEHYIYFLSNKNAYIKLAVEGIISDAYYTPQQKNDLILMPLFLTPSLPYIAEEVFFDFNSNNKITSSTSPRITLNGKKYVGLYKYVDYQTTVFIEDKY